MLWHSDQQHRHHESPNGGTFHHSSQTPHRSTTINKPPQNNYSTTRYPARSYSRAKRLTNFSKVHWPTPFSGRRALPTYHTLSLPQSHHSATSMASSEDTNITIIDVKSWIIQESSAYLTDMPSDTSTMLPLQLLHISVIAKTQQIDITHYGQTQVRKKAPPMFSLPPQ